MGRLASHKWAALGFLISVAYWPGMLSAAFVPRWAVIAAGIPLVSTLDPSRLPESVRWMMIWVLALAGISIASSPDPLSGTFYLLEMIILCGAFLGAAGLDSLEDLVTGLGWGVSVSTVLCVAQYFGWSTGLIVENSSPSGLFFNREVLGEFAALIFVWSALKGKWPLAVLSFAPVVLTQSRVAVLAIAVALAYRFWPKNVGLRIMIPIVVGSIAVSSYVALGPSKIISAAQRLVIWGATVMAMTPLGNGLGWFQAAHPVEQFAHSDVLQTAAELGIGSLALLLIPFLALVRNKSDHVERALFVAICVELLVSFPLHVPASAFLIVVVAAYLVRVRSDVRGPVDVGRIADEDGFQWRGATDQPAFIGS